MRPTEARQQMQPCNSPTAVHMRTYYAHYVQHPRGPDQGLPLLQEGNPYQIVKWPQLLTVQQQPSSYNEEDEEEEWATQQFWRQQLSMSPPPIGSPGFWDPIGAASGARTDLVRSKYRICFGSAPNMQLQHVGSTQGVHVDSFHGSDSEDAPKDVTPKDGSDSEDAPIKKDLRGGYLAALYGNRTLVCS